MLRQTKRAHWFFKPINISAHTSAL